MASNDPQVPWSDEQWARVSQTVQKEAARSRVAASFLPLIGPLPPDTDFVRGAELSYVANPSPPPPQLMHVDDRRTIQLATLQVRAQLRGAQVADPNLSSALEIFRRAASVLARLEDAIVFRGQTNTNQGPPPLAINQLPAIWTVSGGNTTNGLFDWAVATPSPSAGAAQTGQQLVQDVSQQIGVLESRGQFGPFAVVLSDSLFTLAQSPNPNMVLPSDRIIPFLGGGPLLRSSTLAVDTGFIIALGGAPFELVIASDVSVGFLQVTTDPAYVFRVYEKIALRVKEPSAAAALGA
jgi:uncharacterized linocin/CFP29 family protein